MAQDIELQGAQYSDVPAVELPKVGGGTASFTDVTDTTATAADVMSGEYFYTAAGVRSAGTLTFPVTSVDGRTGAVSTAPFLATFNTTDPFTDQADLLTAPGAYTFYIPYNNADMPSTGYSYYGTISLDSTGYGTVIACKSGSSVDVYRRNKNNGTWGSWAKLALMSDLPSVTAFSFSPNNTSSFTSQIDALTSNGVYTFYILSYSHQSATGMPTNENYYGTIYRGSANYVTVVAYVVGKSVAHYRTKTNGTWGSWS